MGDGEEGTGDEKVGDEDGVRKRRICRLAQALVPGGQTTRFATLGSIATRTRTAENTRMENVAAAGKGAHSRGVAPLEAVASVWIRAIRGHFSPLANPGGY